MAEEKILTNEKLSNDELEIVAGGSKEQTDEIKALFKKAKSVGRIGFNNLNEFLSYAGINANMNNDTGNGYFDKYGNDVWIPAENNKYYLISTGLGRSHQEAVAILKEFYALD